MFFEKNHINFVLLRATTMLIIRPILNLPFSIQNQILNELGYKDIGSLLSTSKIVSSNLSERKKVSLLKKFRRLEKQVKKLIQENMNVKALNLIIDFEQENELDDILINKLRRLETRVYNGNSTWM